MPRYLLSDTKYNPQYGPTIDEVTLKGLEEIHDKYLYEWKDKNTSLADAKLYSLEDRKTYEQLGFYPYHESLVDQLVKIGFHDNSLKYLMPFLKKATKITANKYFHRAAARGNFAVKQWLINNKREYLDIENYSFPYGWSDNISLMNSLHFLHLNGISVDYTKINIDQNKAFLYAVDVCNKEMLEKYIDMGFTCEDKYKLFKSLSHAVTTSRTDILDTLIKREKIPRFTDEQYKELLRQLVTFHHLDTIKLMLKFKIPLIYDNEIFEYCDLETLKWWKENFTLPHKDGFIHNALQNKDFEVAKFWLEIKSPEKPINITEDILNDEKLFELVQKIPIKIDHYWVSQLMKEIVQNCLKVNVSMKEYLSTSEKPVYRRFLWCLEHEINN